MTCLEGLARDRNRPLEDIKAAILEIVLGKRDACAGLQFDIGIERLGKDPCRRSFAIGSAENQPEAHAVALNDWQRRFGVMLETRSWASSCASGRATQVWMPNALCGNLRISPGVRSEWVMSRASTIQLTSPGRDDLVRTHAVQVSYLTLIEIGDGRKSDVRMRAHIDPLPGDEFSGSRLVEENERTHHLWLGRGKRPLEIKIRHVDRARHDQRFDGVDADGVGADPGSSRGFQVISASIPANLRDCVREG